MLKNTLIGYLLLIWVALISGCQSGTKKDNTTTQDTSTTTDTTGTSTQTATKPDLKPVDRQFNDLARLLAGLPAEEGSQLAKHHENEAWKKYQQVADKIWEKILKEKRPTMMEWQKKYLQAPNAEAGLLFYPFSGPDFLHASTFFPKLTKIVMMGLEPIGNLPDMENISVHSPEVYYKGLERALYAVLKYSFFITKSMDVDFNGRIDKRIDGTLPAIMIFMARTGHRILNYEKVKINQDGTLAPVDANLETVHNKSVYYGTKLSFHKEGDNTPKTLYFFGVNLSNSPYRGLGGLAQRNDLKQYIQSLKPQATYLKSASYLMYGAGFSTIRNLILNQSKFVLQDDSGMAFKNFTQDNHWNITLFGRYAGPIKLFRHHYQQDLNQAYKKGYPVKELPFGIGYQYLKGNSNLMLAQKK
ncbi:hypothetical protein [uncultured Microscilla sp.]|uniref:hypothetical protein n=1 Tax=uncultured Microscilla sp. TaxID=432653 RepID=UPI00260B7BC0|nr:hypothetical protein [uncultured Microscilla sp.]